VSQGVCPTMLHIGTSSDQLCSTYPFGLLTKMGEIDEFSEVPGSKQPIRRSGKPSITIWWYPVSLQTLRLGIGSCTPLYQ
jgi:hypothetical protein